MPADNPQRNWAGIFRWGLAAVILVYGLVIYDRTSYTWGWAGLLIFALPLLLQFTHYVLTRTYALWFGVFLVLQSVLSFYYLDDFVSLQPNMRITIEIKTTEIPGIQPGTRSVSTDHMGFRVNPGINYHEQKQLFRIFAIGGSTTEELVLDDHNTWPYLLQDGLSKSGIPVNVINTGVSGLRASQHLATLKKISRYQPDMVIFLLGANDWNKHIKDHFEVQNTLLPSLRYSLLGKAIQNFIIFPVKAWLKSAVPSTQHVIIKSKDDWDYEMRSHSLDRTKKYRFRPAAVSQNYQEKLGEISQVCRQLNIPCLFMTQPSGYHPEASPTFRTSFWMTPPFADYTLDFDSMVYIASLYNLYLLEFTRQEKLYFCDIAPGLVASHMYFYDDLHFNEAGARMIAQLLLPCVQDVIHASLEASPRIRAVR